MGIREMKSSSPDVPIQGDKDLSGCSPLKAQLVCRKRQEKIPKVGFQVFGFHVAKNIYCTGQGVYSILNKTS